MPLLKAYFDNIKNVLCLLLLIIMAAAAGCTRADVNYGSQFTGDEYTNLVMTDTFTIETGTVLLDSFVTSASGAAVIGSYKDEQFGQINAETYMQLQAPSFTDKYVSYDSLELVLHLNNTWYGDTTQPLQLNVYRVAADISNSNNSYFYNNDQVAHETSALGARTVAILPHSTDTIAIKLDDSLGRDLLDKLASSDGNVTTTTAFLNYFKGICVAANQSNALVFGCKDSIEMRLHYKETSAVIPQNKTAVFSLYNNIKQFNHISIDRSGTALETLNAKNNYLNSAATGNQSFMQYITGTTVKISIPYIRDLLQIPGFIKIEKATLTLKPVVGTYAGYYTLPDSLRLSQTDKNNQPGYDITYTDGSTQYGSFYRDYLYEQTTGYTYDMGSYLTTQLNIAENNENGVLVRPPASNEATIFNRAVFGGQNNVSGGIKMQLYYLSVQ